MQIDLRRSSLEVVDRQGGDGDRDDRDKRRGVGLALGQAAPNDLQRHHDEAAAHAEKTTHQTPQQADRGEPGAAAYSGALGAGSAGVVTAWCRNWTSPAVDPAGSLTFFFFLASRPCLSRPLPMASSFYYESQFAQ